MHFPCVFAYPTAGHIGERGGGDIPRCLSASQMKGWVVPGVFVLAPVFLRLSFPGLRGGKGGAGLQIDAGKPGPVPGNHCQRGIRWGWAGR